MSRRPAFPLLAPAVVSFALSLGMFGPGVGRALAQGATPAPAPAASPPAEAFRYFGFLDNPHYDSLERGALFVVLLVALSGLVYAALLVRQVLAADQGTPKMQEIARAIREGANAYLGRQFKALIGMVALICALLYVTGGAEWDVRVGRVLAFFVGAAFSWTVGYVGMSLAVRGNLRVAAAARTSYGAALQIGYRTGTVTGMLCDGLGLLGGTVIFMAYGEQAYEVLLGFGFGGTLLALFMRVGGGIYTKAADVGADLVGKVEAGIPEDDPRNAATIADNVGDNVGDCAGMAADIFESYEVTIVAAMILGYASFGHKGVIFPLLVRAIGVVGSIISTYMVKASAGSTSDEALHSVHKGFLIGSAISVVGFFALGLGYLHTGDTYIKQNPQALGGYEAQLSEGFKADRASFEAGHAATREADPRRHAADFRAFVTNYPGAILGAGLPFWTGFGISGLDMRPALACLIGIVLAVVLNKCTSYYTHTQYAPVKSLVKACTTGHATNIIQGFAVGYESAVVGTLVIAAAILLSVLIFAGTSPIFVAYGVAMCGIGMLTLTGNTISMDVFGPVADNSNGIGEMGYDRSEMGEENYKRARQILADLDAVGNTTKAETKGIAIGSAVFAAVSLFASFIAVITVGSESRIGEMTTREFLDVAGRFSMAQPIVFVGMLIGGVMPLLYSSMLIRAVGRAAFLIVKECRLQFRDAEIWAGTKTPDYGRVVNICTVAAQRELVGPGVLAIAVPVSVGIFLGPYALGGFLAGTIVVGQILAVFMANAGGAWDNAKKSIEDGVHGGKGSEAHKASVTGDTVGDPLKDTAGPALNPLIEAMNMVALLAIGPILAASDPESGHGWLLYLVGVVALAVAGLAVWRSKTDSQEFKALEAEFAAEKAEEDLQAVGGERGARGSRSGGLTGAGVMVRSTLPSFLTTPAPPADDARPEGALEWLRRSLNAPATARWGFPRVRLAWPRPRFTLTRGLIALAVLGIAFGTVVRLHRRRAEEARWEPRKANFAALAAFHSAKNRIAYRANDGRWCKYISRDGRVMTQAEIADSLRHGRLAKKYALAATRPWLPVDLDPPQNGSGPAG